MKRKIYTADRETGTFIDEFASIEDARAAIQQYEESDKNDGIYEPDFYDIVDEERYSYDDSGLTTLYFVATNGYYMLISDNGELRRVLVDNNDVLLCDFADNAEKYLLDVVEDDSSWEISEESAEQIIGEADGEVLAEIRKYL